MQETVLENPLSVEPDAVLSPKPCTLVIFGGSGDLSQRKLLPALYNLAVEGVLPVHFLGVGFSRESLNDEAFRNHARTGIDKFSRRPLETGTWEGFSRSLHYVQGSFDDPEAYAGLKARLEAVERKFNMPGNRIFYLAVPPSLIDVCVKQLKEAGLIWAPGVSERFTRVIVEKPVGRDLKSAHQINARLSKVFDESQIFRIDHYLGKETVQNLMVLRFANSIFEPLWNHKYVDHIQITVAEEEGVGRRATYYEEAGAIRDMVQNHILQLLSLTAMEPPRAMSADVVRDRKLDVLKGLRPIEAREGSAHVVRAQYGQGFHRGEPVPGYRQEKGVKPDSATETYVAMKVFVDNWRWAGVPFYLRTGKRLPKRASEIAVHFKEVPHILFNKDPGKPVQANILALRIQPDEGLSMLISSKIPGPQARIHPVRMDFRYGTTFGEQSPEAYERLLLDVMAGDATLFMRRDAVEASWEWVTPLLDAGKGGGAATIPEYPAGSWGPREAEDLIQADGRAWRTL